MEKKTKFNKPIPKKININQKPIKTARIINKKSLSSKPKNTPENRLSDLENTLDLNIQILKTFYNSSKSKSVEALLTNESIIKDAIDNIKKKYLQKKQLFNQLKEKK